MKSIRKSQCVLNNGESNRIKDKHFYRGYNKAIEACTIAKMKMLEEKDKRIAELESELSKQSHSAQFRRVEALQAKISELEKQLYGGWISVNDEEPPQDGSYFFTAYKYSTGWVYEQCFYGTYHPNAKGKECYRNIQGNKTKFTHWRPLPSAPGSESDL